MKARWLLAGVIVPLVVCCSWGAARAQDMITGLTTTDVWQVLQGAGLRDLTDRTADPDFPAVSGLTDDGFTIQVTLHACGDQGVCGGASIVALLASTSEENALRIERSVDQGLAEIDARIVLNVGDVPAIVELSHYMMLDYGASTEKFPVVVSYLLDIVSQTKQFMLSDDPGHADLWDRSP